MAEQQLKHFIVGDELNCVIESTTGTKAGRFKRRDFVTPLVAYCENGDYTANIGIVYGLRSTGKTVGMLQSAKTLMEKGHKAAYARFNYDEFAIGDCNIEMKILAEQGYKYFFIDEATYLEGFLNGSAEWPDRYVTGKQIKIIISGTDSFLLNLARATSLFHRYEQFSTNWCSFEEYRRIHSLPFRSYKTEGGIFKIKDNMSEFIQSAIVTNLLHTIKHSSFDTEYQNAYSDRLIGVNAAAIYKAIVSILKCTVEKPIKKHFAEYANDKNILDFGEAVSNWTKDDKYDLRNRVADAMTLYNDFDGIEHPHAVIETLIAFLRQIDCLTATYSTPAINGVKDTLYYFSQPALMSFAIDETLKGVLELGDINHVEFERGIRQAAEGFINESIVFAHVLRGAKKKDEVFRYRDEQFREIDIVVKNFSNKTVQLIEVKSKDKLDVNSVFSNEARHLYDDEVLAKLGINNEYKISRIIVYLGDSKILNHDKGNLALENIEYLLTKIPINL
jgi:predicted AAA+ superfamily ATPase